MRIEPPPVETVIKTKKRKKLVGRFIFYPRIGLLRLDGVFRGKQIKYEVEE